MAMSPMMQEYCKTKEQYKDCILFYRLGDFYEMFFDDALLVTRELEQGAPNPVKAGTRYTPSLFFTEVAKVSI